MKPRQYFETSGISDNVFSFFLLNYNVRKFYKLTCTYVVKRLLFPSDILKHAKIAVPAFRIQVSFYSGIINCFCDNISIDVLMLCK